MLHHCFDLLALVLMHRRQKDYLRWYFKHSKKMLRFKNIHHGEDCFIIGNGPSLNKMDLSLLKDHHTFGLNKIYLMFDRVDLNLSYHVAVNPLVIEQSTAEFEALNCPSFLSYGPAHKVVRPLDHLNFIATNSICPMPFSFCGDLTMPLHEGYTVTYVAMQIAFYMGFRNVYLVGVDHNFNASGAPNSEQMMQGEDQNHFDPRYFADKRWHLPDLQASELSYCLAKYFYAVDGRQIWDATVGGKLQVFPRIEFRQALGRCKKRTVSGALS